MAQLLGNILSDRNYSEPPEIGLIKKFVHDEVGLTPRVSITTRTYVISISNAAAAGMLRSKLHLLQKQLGNDKRILIRIG